MKRTFILFLMFPLAFTGCDDDTPAVKEALRPVRTLTVQAQTGERTRTLAGTAQAGQESRLSFKVGGTLSQLGVKVGDRVDAGQVIARIDPKDLQLQVQQAEASLANAEAQFRNADADYERVRSLYEKGNTSRKDLDAARAGSESARAQVDASRTALDLAGTQRSYAVLRAPIAGAIAEVPVEINENVKNGDTIAVLTSGNQLEVQMAVPESLIDQVRSGARAQVRFDAINRSLPFEGVITEVGVSTRQSATYPVKLRLNEEDSRVRPGMAAEITLFFNTGATGPQIVVPPVAVSEDREGRFVFVVEKVEPGVGKVVRRQVEVGELTSEGLVIVRGLANGDLLITAGTSRIRPDQRVKISAPEGKP